ncbi:unnamed protein product, partial [Brenthis ino]
MNAWCKMLFFISLLLLNELPSFTNAVKPLEPAKQSSTDSVALLNMKSPGNRTSVSKSSAHGKSSAQVPYNMMARVNDEDNINLKDSSEKSYPDNRANDVKLSNKEIIDKILNLILKNKQGHVKEKLTYGNQLQANELNSHHHHSNIGFGIDEDWLPYSPQGLDKPGLYAMKLPIKAIQTPRGGILGKLQFHFAPLHKHIEP